MTEQLAILYIARRMEELKIEHYFIRLRHFSLKGTEERIVQAAAHLFLLLEPSGTVSIQSDAGGFDLSSDSINEQQYEHFGTINLKNNAPTTQHVRFIQIIEKQKDLCQLQMTVSTS